MKPFRFSLEPLLTLRQQKERNAQKAFAEAMRACDEAAFQLQTASDELAKAWSSLCGDLATGVSATQLARTRAWCNVLELRQQECAATLQTARYGMDAAMREMLLATRHREALDQYKTKHRSAHALNLQREEQKTLDEIGVRRSVAMRTFQSTNRKRTKSL